MIHIIRTTAADCLNQMVSLLSDNDTVIFMDDSCYALPNQIETVLKKNVSIFALENHLSARNINQHKNIEVIKMADLVSLLADNNNSMTWQ